MMELFSAQAWYDFHFLRPVMLLWLLPLLWLFYQGRKQNGGLQAWQKVVSPVLLDYLQAGKPNASSRTLLWKIFWISLLMVIALAGPTWKKLPQPLYSNDSALVVALDLSQSMNAQDIKPNRLTRAKQKLTDLLRLRAEGQTALLVFAGSAFVVTPLTDDHKTILSQLSSLTTDIMPVQGGDLDTALAKAKMLFKQAGIKQGDILLLTDSSAYTKAQVQDVVRAGFHVHVIGIGTPEGAPIPEIGGGFLSDEHGQIVIAKLDEDRLRELADLGQGTYHRLRVDDADIVALTQANMPAQVRQQHQPDDLSPTHDVWQEEGHWLLLLALPLLLLMFRRGMLVVALMFVLQSQPADAGVLDNLWQTPNQQGEALMQQKQYADAYQRFEDPRWKASAAYRNQDYQAAVDALNTIEQPTADDWYNKGNALAHLGKKDEAIDAYDQALRLNPKHADALANKKILQAQQEQDKKQQQQGEDKQDKGKQDQQQNDKGQQSENKQDQSKQGQDKQGQDQQSKKQQGQPQGKDAKQGKPQDSQGKQDKPKAGKQKTQSGEQSNQKSGDVPPGQQDTAQHQQDLEQAQKAMHKDMQKQLAKQQKGKEGERKQDKKDKPQSALISSSDDIEKTEEQQQFEQQLRRVPDDPSGLLRRKFLYQYQQQGRRQPQRSQSW